MRKFIAQELERELENISRVIQNGSLETRVSIDLGKEPNSDRLNGIKKEISEFFQIFKLSFHIQSVTNKEASDNTPEEEKLQELEITPLANYIEKDQITEESEDRPTLNLPPSPKGIQKTRVHHKNLENEFKKTYSSARYVKPGNQENLEKGLDNSDKEKIKENGDSLFESIYQPNSIPKAESSKLFDFVIDPVPDPSDSNFNKFLDSELDRIKKAFLEDGPSPWQPSIPKNTKEKKEEIEIPKRSSSIGAAKRSSLNGQVSQNQTPGLKKSTTHLSYKEKFEDLYFNGKTGKGGNQKKGVSSSVTNSFKRSIVDLQDDFKLISNNSKALSRYSRQPTAAINPPQAFSPLFKQ